MAPEKYWPWMDLPRYVAPESPATEPVFGVVPIN